MKQNRSSLASSVAMGGVFAALALVLMLLGGLVPAATFVCPMLASLLLIPLLDRLPRGLCWGWHAVTALLCVLLCPDREAAFFFAFLGWYPIVKPKLDRLPLLPRILIKLLIYCLAVTAVYALLILVFRLEALVQEAKEAGKLLLGSLVLGGAAVFLLYDLALTRLTAVYRLRSRRR